MPETAYIDGSSIRKDYGAILCDGGVAALLAPPALKPCIVASSRLQHGERILSSSNGTSLTRVAARDLTLTFAISANGYQDLDSKLQAFLERLQSGPLTLEVPQLPGRKFRLLYQSATQLSQTAGQLLTVAVRFREPNPKNRA